MTLELPKLSSETLTTTFKNTTYTKFYGVSSNPNVVKVNNLSGIRIEGLIGGKAIVTIRPIDPYAEDHGFEPVKIKVTVTTPMIKDENGFTFRFRKSIGHMMGFLIDGLLFTLMMWLYFEDKKRFYLILSAIPIGGAFCGLSELLQMTQPTRGPSFMDVGIDFIGWSIGFALIFIIYLITILVKRYKNKTTKKD